MKKMVIVITAAIFLSSCALNEKLFSRKSSNEKPVIFGVLNLTNTVGYLDDDKKLVSISFIYGDKFPTLEEVEKIDESGVWMPKNAKDILVKINKEDFDQMKSENKAYWVHAKWVVWKNGRWIDADPPVNPAKPRRKTCLIFQYGKLEDLKKELKYKHSTKTEYKTETQNVGESTKKPETNPCPRTDADCAKLRKKLNPKTCNCE